MRLALVCLVLLAVIALAVDAEPWRRPRRRRRPAKASCTYPNSGRCDEEYKKPGSKYVITLKFYRPRKSRCLRDVGCRKTECCVRAINENAEMPTDPPTFNKVGECTKISELTNMDNFQLTFITDIIRASDDVATTLADAARGQNRLAICRPGTLSQARRKRRQAGDIPAQVAAADLVDDVSGPDIAMVADPAPTTPPTIETTPSEGPTVLPMTTDDRGIIVAQRSPDMSHFETQAREAEELLKDLVSELNDMNGIH